MAWYRELSCRAGGCSFPRWGKQGESCPGASSFTEHSQGHPGAPIQLSPPAKAGLQPLFVWNGWANRAICIINMINFKCWCLSPSPSNLLQILLEQDTEHICYYLMLLFSKPFPAFSCFPCEDPCFIIPEIATIQLPLPSGSLHNVISTTLTFPKEWSLSFYWDFNSKQTQS